MTACSIYYSIHETILQQIPSVYLREYLLHHAQDLQDWQYISLICGLPADLALKIKLMREYAILEPSAAPYYRQMEKAPITLHSFGGSGELFLRSRWAFRPDSPFQMQLTAAEPFSFLSAALQSVQNFYDDMYADCTEKEKQADLPDWYYRLELCKEQLDGTYCTIYTFLLSDYGTVRYFFIKNGIFNRLLEGDVLDSAFAGGDLSVPVPYQPGDILSVDCRPYGPKAFCLIVDIGDNFDCCCVQSLYPQIYGLADMGSLKHGRYYTHGKIHHLSPLYTAERYTDHLPKEYQFFLPISQKLKENSSFGKELDNYTYQSAKRNGAFGVTKAATKMDGKTAIARYNTENESELLEGFTQAEILAFAANK